MNRHDARRARFVAEYAIDLNASAAAIRAGYAARWARHIGYRLLQDPGIAEALALQAEARLGRLCIDTDAVLAEVARIAFADPRRLVTADGRHKTIGELDDEIAAALEAVETEERAGTSRLRRVRLAPKLKALLLLADHLDLWSDQLFWQEEAGEEDAS